MVLFSPVRYYICSECSEPVFDSTWYIRIKDNLKPITPIMFYFNTQMHIYTPFVIIVVQDCTPLP